MAEPPSSTHPNPTMGPPSVHSDGAEDVQARQFDVIMMDCSSHNSKIQSSPIKMDGLSSNETGIEYNVDPRTAAAMLKEKLLRNKGQRYGHENSPGPLGEVSHNTVRPVQGSFSEASVTNSGLVPPPLAQMSSHNSVPADADDVVALIRSISSVTHDKATGPAGKTTELTLSGPGVTFSPASTAVPPKQICNDEKLPGLNRTPRNPPGEPGQVADPFGLSSQAEQGSVKNDRDALDAQNIARLLSNAQRTSTGMKLHGETADTARFEEQKQQNSINSEGASVTSWDGYSPSSNTNRSNQAENGKISLSTHKANTLDASGNLSNGKANQAVAPALAQLLEDDRDLRDWLVYTGYFDVEARSKKLTRYRKLAEMDAEEQRIKAEQERLAARRRKLLEEDDLDRLLLPYPGRLGQTPQPFAPATPNTDVSPTKLSYAGVANPSTSAIDPPASTSTPTGVTTNLQIRDNRAEPGEDDAAKASIALKRRFDDDGDQGRSHADKMPKLNAQDVKDVVPKLEDSPGDRGRANDGDYRTTHRQRSRSRQRNESYRRHSPGREDGNHDRNKFRIGRYETYREKGKWDDRQRPASPGGHNGRPLYNEPKPIDLGRKGDTRFFMVKSFTEDHVRECMDDGLWTTQTHNAEILASAFAQCKNVILVFSVNKSKAFQGFARMTSAPSPDIPRPRWIKHIHWDTSPPFRVEWLSTTEVEFYHIGHLLNKLNDNLPVLVGKDGQEIEEECGRRLLEEMTAVIHSKIEYYMNDENGRPRDPDSPRDARGRGRYQARGRGRANSLKREDR